MTDFDELNGLLSAAPARVYRGPNHVHAGSTAPRGRPAPAPAAKDRPALRALQQGPSDDGYAGDPLGIDGLDTVLTRGYRIEDSIALDSPTDDGPADAIPLVAIGPAPAPMKIPPGSLLSVRSHVAPPPQSPAPSTQPSTERAALYRELAGHMRVVAGIYERLAALDALPAPAPAPAPPVSEVAASPSEEEEVPVEEDVEVFEAPAPLSTPPSAGG